jgi:hypothetical protein
MAERAVEDIAVDDIADCAAIAATQQHVGLRWRWTAASISQPARRFKHSAN